LARAKSTRRAEARRRHRAAQAAARAAGTEDDEETSTRGPDRAEPETSAGRPGFRLPDVRGDLLALPATFREKPLLFAPLGLMLLAFLLTFLPVPTDQTLQFVVTFFISSFLGPGILAMFLGGVLAPRAPYLVGLLLGLVNGVLLFARAAFTVSNTNPAAPAALATNALEYIPLLALYGVAIGAFAGWYRDFLRRSGQRRRATMEARARERKRDTRRAARPNR
jgi:hypothetical protein